MGCIFTPLGNKQQANGFFGIYYYYYYLSIDFIHAEIHTSSSN
jgi:hypothetical protein